ncbi:Blue-light-activated histidine kinase 1 [Rhodobacteraceae bacterium THAF1]|uniref:PAS domain-containing protein n=1 Tax=Palleronia sp. THAF1 TaxID=2587842 RepID=UPI000F41AB61|nr:PAS domain-containing protein [Palleronia sp. THAF1]QFU09449.1 Blue-light-activated histidine kinase 1 [Palleronia sp. THAF1]VDC21889.1 Blue-light-activated histidine kinase 1 [Rhodobacteraceae bacterium THAF1]
MKEYINDPDQSQAHRTFDERAKEARGKAAAIDGSISGASGVLFEQAMAQTRMAVCLSDPNQDDNPIVFANKAFLSLTGYEEDEIVGHNCRFLQGPKTDKSKVDQIRKALETEDVIVVELLNYRKDGTEFWNALHLGPIYGPDGQLLYYFGSQWDVSDVHAARADELYAKTVARELSHRMKNMFSVIGGLVTVTGRTRGIQNEAAEINDRIRAMGRAFETTLDDATHGNVDFRSAVKAVVAPYDPEGTRIKYVGSRLRVSPNAVSTLGLVMHELATNAIKYGALSNDTGTVTVSWSADSENLMVDWKEAGAPDISEPNRTGSGLGIIATLLSASGGRIEPKWQPNGLQMRIVIPHG